MQRGVVGSALACCKAGLSSNLGSAPHGSSAHWADSYEDMEMGLSECLWMNDCMNVSTVLYKEKYIQKEWHTATKPLKYYLLELDIRKISRVSWHPHPPPFLFIFPLPLCKAFSLHHTYECEGGWGEGGAPWNLIRVSIQKLCSISYGKTYMSFVHLTRSVYCLATGLKGAYHKK